MTADGRCIAFTNTRRSRYGDIYVHGCNTSSLVVQPEGDTDPTALAEHPRLS